ncbi:HAMP domain protein, partial [Vibrio cholerae HC-71A1]
PVNRPPIFVT